MMKIFLALALMGAIIGAQGLYINDGSDDSGEKYLIEVPEDYEGEENEDRLKHFLDDEEDDEEENDDDDDDDLIEEEEDDELTEDSNEDLVSEGGALVRTKRQARDRAVSLALDHQDRPVGKIHGSLNADGFRNDRNNHHVNLGLGLGTVVHRSKNNRHSLGVGVAVDHYRGRQQGFGYRSKPSFGAGVGYRFRF